MDTDPDGLEFAGVYLADISTHDEAWLTATPYPPSVDVLMNDIWEATTVVESNNNTPVDFYSHLFILDNDFLLILVLSFQLRMIMSLLMLSLPFQLKSISLCLCYPYLAWIIFLPSIYFH